jgi:hypothetical protein
VRKKMEGKIKRLRVHAIGSRTGTVGRAHLGKAELEG